METIWEHDAVGEYYFEMYSNPTVFDSDGDFKSDYQEDKDGTNPFGYDESMYDFLLGMIQGDFIREPQGALTVAGQVVGGFVPISDARDIWANLKHGNLGMAALSIMGLVPGIGDVAKSADTIIKFIVKNADNIDEVVKLLKIVSANWDDVAKLLGKSDEFKTVMKKMLTNPDAKYTKAQVDDLMELLKKADLEELAYEATNPDIRRFLDSDGTLAKGLIGNDFENYLSKTIGGEGSFSVGGRDFDGV